MKKLTELELIRKWRSEGCETEIAELRIRERRGEKISDLQWTIAAQQNMKGRRNKPGISYEQWEIDLAWDELIEDLEVRG